MLFSPKRTCSRFAALTLRVTSHRNVPLGHSGVAHGLFSFRTITPNGAPVFRSAYSASRNARASAAFAASIEAHCAVCRETRMLQVRYARPAPSHRNDPSGRSGVTVGLFPQRVHSTLCSKTLDLQVRCANPTGRGELRIHPPPFPAGAGTSEKEMRRKTEGRSAEKLLK